MSVRRVGLALAMLAALASDSWGKSRQPAFGQAAQAAPDPRGTEQMPLAVKIMPSGAEPPAERQERDGREKAEADRLQAQEIQRMAEAMRWLVALATALVAIALAQAGLFAWQLTAMRRAMVSSREEFIARHRPRLTIRWARIGKVDIDGNNIQVHFAIHNAGGSDAVITASSINADFLGDTDWPSPHDYPVNNLVMGNRIAPGANSAVVLPMNGMRNLAGISDEEMEHLRLFGYVVYRDALQNTRTTYFCRQYQRGQDRFTPVDDPDYELAD